MTAQLLDSRPIICDAPELRDLSVANRKDVHGLEPYPGSGGGKAIPLANMRTLVGQPDPDPVTRTDYVENVPDLIGPHPSEPSLPKAIFVYSLQFRWASSDEVSSEKGLVALVVSVTSFEVVSDYLCVLGHDAVHLSLPSHSDNERCREAKSTSAKIMAAGRIAPKIWLDLSGCFLIMRLCHQVVG